MERLDSRPWLNRHPSAGAAKVPRCQAAKPPAPTPARLAARMRVYILGKPPNPEPRRLRAGLLRLGGGQLLPSLHPLDPTMNTYIAQLCVSPNSNLNVLLVVLICSPAC